MRTRIRDLQAAQWRRDPPGAAEQRIREREAGERAYRESRERFPELTAANFDECQRWIDQRRAELLSAL
jgi:hypothetical protein